MDRVNFVVRLGGVLTVLVTIHFVVDWIFQSHSEAMRKHDHPWVRARHCAIYTAPFVPLLVWLHVPAMWTAIGAAVLFLSHFGEDTYIPVFWWARYMRRPPEMFGRPKEVILKEMASMSVQSLFDAEEKARKEKWDALDKELRTSTSERAQLGFREFISTTLGKILMIAVDQIIHVLFLVPVAWIILRYGR